MDAMRVRNTFLEVEDELFTPLLSRCAKRCRSEPPPTTLGAAADTRMLPGARRWSEVLPPEDAPKVTDTTSEADTSIPMTWTQSHRTSFSSADSFDGALDEEILEPSRTEEIPGSPLCAAPLLAPLLAASTVAPPSDSDVKDLSTQAAKATSGSGMHGRLTRVPCKGRPTPASAATGQHRCGAAEPSEEDGHARWRGGWQRPLMSWGIRVPFPHKPRPVAANQRTTVVIRNLPVSFTREMVAAMLDEQGFQGQYNFLYLPINFETGFSLGHATVNLTSPGVVPDFWERLDGYSHLSPGDGGRTFCRVSWSSPHQGLSALVDHHRNSCIMHADAPDELRPVILYGGSRVAFPPPTKKLIPPPRRFLRAHGTRRA